MASAEENQSFENEYKDRTTISLIHEMSEVQAKKEAAEEELSSINKRYDYLRLAIIPHRMENEGVTSMKVDGVGRATVTSDIYASIKSDSKTEAYNWLGDNGHGDLVTRTVNSSSLKAAIKALIRKGETVPDELFNVTPFNRVSITKR